MRIALVGYGKMGRAVEAAARERGHTVVARLGRDDERTAEGLAGAEVAIEFTTPHGAVENIRRLAELGVTLVVGTTGWYDRLDDARAAVDAAGTGLVFAPNFSIGVHLFSRLVRRLGELMSPWADYDLAVHEMHHRHKLDHPSGTAARLAELLVESVARKERWVAGPPEGVADPRTLWVTSARVGEVPGIHTITADGPDDRIEIRHEARGRSGFARGAVTAAEWVHGRTGVYTLDDVLRDLLQSED